MQFSSRRLRRGKQLFHGLSQQRNNRKDPENCSERNEETFDTSHYQGKGVMLVAGQASSGDQNTNRPSRRRVKTKTNRLRQKSSQEIQAAALHLVSGYRA